jgi:hypothetical protein
MSNQGRFVFFALWLLSLLIVGGLVSAQTRREPAPVISGNDIGFRPEGWNGKARIGTWLVRIDGEWVEAQAAVKTIHATTP